MKKIFAVLSCLVIGYVNGQTIQNGVIQEYNEKAKKTPLEGVELNVRSASSTVSDKNGKFSLEFLTLTPGEKVNIRRLEKLGYEIFNKEAVEQWNINPKIPFVIVMCRSDRFKKIRDNYEKVASESYARQLKKEETALAQLKAAGQLKDEEYQRQLYELRESYEKQLDNLDNYVDRFSRIDLSELSAVEQKIIDLVQQGKIEEAIAKYEQQHYVDKYLKEVSDIKKVSSAIDQLSDIKQSKESLRDDLLGKIDRQIEMLKLAGGRENYEKIGIILHDIYSVDSTNYNITFKYADYLYDIMDYHKAYQLYSKLKSDYVNRGDIIQIMNRIIIIEKERERNDSALFESFELEDIFNKNNSLFSDNELIGIYINRGLIYLKQQDVNNAKKCFEKALSLDAVKSCSPLVLASLKNSLSSVLTLEHDYDGALFIYKDILSVYETLNDGSEASNERLAGITLNLAQTCRHVKDSENAKKYINKSILYIKDNYVYNPSGYASLYSRILNSAGIIFSDNNEFSKAEEYYNQALSVINSKYEEYPAIFWQEYYQVLMNKAILYTTTKSYQKAIETFQIVLLIAEKSPESNFRNKTLCEIQYNFSYVYCIIGQYDQAIELLNKSLIYAESLLKHNKRYAAMSYLQSINNLGYCYDKTNDAKTAKKIYQTGLDFIEKLELCDVYPFKEQYANLIYNIGVVLHHKEHLFSEAINFYHKAYELYVELDSDDDLLETSVGLADAYLMEGQIDNAEKWIVEYKDVEKRNLHIGWLLTRGEIAYKTNDIDLAKKCRDAILEINPDINTEGMELFSLLETVK